MRSVEYAVARCLYVRPSVHHIPRYYFETAKHVIKLCSPSGSHIILVFTPNGLWQWGPHSGDGKCRRGMLKSRFLTNISLYLGKDTKESHSCCGMRTGDRIQAFEWYYFEWPWVTSNPDFKITPLYDAEYLGHGTRWRHSYNGILIVT